LDLDLMNKALEACLCARASKCNIVPKSG